MPAPAPGRTDRPPRTAEPPRMATAAAHPVVLVPPARPRAIALLPRPPMSAGGEAVAPMARRCRPRLPRRTPSTRHPTAFGWVDCPGLTPSRRAWSEAVRRRLPAPVPRQEGRSPAAGSRTRPVVRRRPSAPRQPPVRWAPCRRSSTCPADRDRALADRRGQPPRRRAAPRRARLGRARPSPSPRRRVCPPSGAPRWPGLDPSPSAATRSVVDPRGGPGVAEPQPRRCPAGRVRQPQPRPMAPRCPRRSSAGDRDRRRQDRRPPAGAADPAARSRVAAPPWPDHRLGPDRPPAERRRGPRPCSRSGLARSAAGPAVRSMGRECATARWWGQAPAGAVPAVPAAPERSMGRD